MASRQIFTSCAIVSHNNQKSLVCGFCAVDSQFLRWSLRWQTADTAAEEGGTPEAAALLNAAVRVLRVPAMLGDD